MSETEKTTSNAHLRHDQMTAEELSVIEYLERSYGRKLTPQEENLSLEQA